MDRIREARRGTIASANGGLSRRRQRSSSLRDSPEEDGAMEMHEMSRLRDRGFKKDRDFDRSSRTKRRRSDTMMHGCHREDGDESSEGSVPEEEDYEEDETSPGVRLPLQLATSTTVSVSAMQSHLRKGYPAKAVRPSSAGGWKVAEDMIGAPIPRKARSSSVKRSQEYWISSGGGGGGGGGGGEQVNRQASTSPVRRSPSSTAPVSPSSSNASVRKKMKLIDGTKHRPPKTSKTSSIQEIEIEVAEVLFGMTRQVSLKPEIHKNDCKESNKSGNEVHPRFPSPCRISSSPVTSQPSTLPPSTQSPNSSSLTANAPKRKRPRMRFDEKTPVSSPSTAAPSATTGSSAPKFDPEGPPTPAGPKVDAASPTSQKNHASSSAENVSVLCDSGIATVPSTLASAAKVQQEAVKQESKSAPEPEGTDIRAEKKAKQEVVSPSKEPLSANLDVNPEESSANKAVTISDDQRDGKLSIDLMVPLPVGKSSSGMERRVGETEMPPKLEVIKFEGEKKMERNLKPDPEEIILDETNGRTPLAAKEGNPDPQLDLVKPDKDVTGGSKHHAQPQPSRAQRPGPKAEKAAPAASFPLPMQISGWPTGFPPLGYVGQVPRLPAVVPLEGGSNSNKAMQGALPSQLRPKRCATHFSIAQTILYNQQISRISPFWPSPAAAGAAAALYGPKQFNLNSVPPTDSAILGGPLQGGVPGKNLGSVQEKCGPSSTGHSNLSIKEKSKGISPLGDGYQRKPSMLQQSSQPGSAGNMLAPAFIFPLNQQQTAVPNRSGAGKHLPGSGNANQSSPAVATSVAPAPGTTMNFNYPGLPPSEAQYLAFLQNNGYPFTIPAPVGGAQQYRGATPAQAVPIFNFSFYSSQMLHPSQLRLQPQPATSLQQAPHPQPVHQNPSTSSGSSSSQKNTQQSQRVPPAVPGTVSAGHPLAPPSKHHHLLPHQSRQLESDPGCEDAPSTADSRVLQAQKTVYGSKFAMPCNSQNFTLVSSANPSERNQQQQAQNQVVKVDHLTPPQAFAMSFSSFGGTAPHGLDFSSMAQSNANALFQSLPEAARHGFQMSTAIAAQQQHHKKAEDGKSAADLVRNGSAVGDDGKVSSVGKVIGNGQHQQQSLTFSRADADPLASSIHGGSTNLVQHQTSAAALRASTQAGGSAALASNSIALKQQVHLQHQHLRAKPASSNSSNSVYMDRLPGNSNPSKFSQPLAGFSPTLVQSTSSVQSPQWKAAARAATPSPSSASSKTQIPMQQQSRSQPLLAHQTQISFGVSPTKIAATGGGNNAASLSSTAATGSPQNSISKNSVGSPRSSVTKSGTSLPSVLPPSPFQKQQLGKNSSPSTSTISPLPSTNRNTHSILGNPQINASSKPQPPKQHFPQAQLFFSNPYTTQSDAAIAGFFHQQHPHRPLQQTQPSSTGSTSMLSLGPSPSLTLAAVAAPAPDPAKSSSAKGPGSSPAGLLQHPGQLVGSAAPHPLMSAAAAAFPYIHTMQSVPLKPSPAAEQKPAAGR